MNIHTDTLMDGCRVHFMLFVQGKYFQRNEETYFSYTLYEACLMNV